MITPKELSKMQKDPSLNALFEDGWEPTWTGGGCTGWEKKDGEDELSHWLMSADGTIRESVSDPIWGVNRYRTSDDGGDVGCMCVMELTDVATILENYRRIPKPDDGQYVDYKSWDEVPAAETSPKP